MSAPAACLESRPDGVLLRVRVTPRSSRNQIGEVVEDRVKIRIAAPPVDSAANVELIKFLSKQLGVPKSRLELTAGQTSRNKTVLISGLDADAVSAALFGN